MTTTGAFWRAGRQGTCERRIGTPWRIWCISSRARNRGGFADLKNVYPTRRGLWVKSKLFLARYRTSRLPRNPLSKTKTTGRSAPLQGRCNMLSVGFQMTAGRKNCQRYESGTNGGTAWNSEVLTTVDRPPEPGQRSTDPRPGLVSAAARAYIIIRGHNEATTTHSSRLQGVLHYIVGRGPLPSRTSLRLRKGTRRFCSATRF